MLRNRRSTIGLTVTDHNAACFGRSQIDIIAAGRRNQDQFQFRRLLNGRSINQYFIANNDLNLGHAGSNLGSRSRWIQHKRIKGCRSEERRVGKEEQLRRRTLDLYSSEVAARTL